MINTIKIPRWGKHKNIKYSPRRSILKICPQCNKLFLQYKKGHKIYCSDICSANAHRQQKKINNKKMAAKRDKYQHAEQERIRYALGLSSKSKSKPGTDQIPKPKIDSNGEPDWEEYHRTLSNKLKKLGIKIT